VGYSIKTLADGRFALMNSRTNCHFDMAELVSPDRQVIERAILMARLAEQKDPNALRGAVDFDASY